MRVLWIFVIVLALLPASYFTARATFLKRSSALGISGLSHYQSPSVVHFEIDGHIISDRSTGGRNQTGGFSYASPFSDRMQLDLTWYDILAKKAYRISFSVRASELSTFGTAGEQAGIAVVAGPGADVTVTTPDPEEMRLIGLKLSEELAALPRQPPVVLRELCAKPIPLDDPMAKLLAGAVEDWSLEYAMETRKLGMEQFGTVTPRCPEE